MDKHFADISRNAFLLILFLVAALLLASLLSYVLVPEYKRYVSSKDSYLALSATADDGRNYRLEMERIQATISTLEQEMNSADLHLPYQQFESHVISELQSLAWKNDIRLGGVSPMQGQMVDHYREVVFDVDLSGDYFDLYRFLLDLKKAPDFLVINEFSIFPKQSINPDPEMEVKMSIASYRPELL